MSSEPLVGYPELGSTYKPAVYGEDLQAPVVSPAGDANQVHIDVSSMSQSPIREVRPVSVNSDPVTFTSATVDTSELLVKPAVKSTEPCANSSVETTELSIELAVERDTEPTAGRAMGFTADFQPAGRLLVEPAASEPSAGLTVEPAGSGPSAGLAMEPVDSQPTDQFLVGSADSEPLAGPAAEPADVVSLRQVGAGRGDSELPFGLTAECAEPEPPRGQVSGSAESPVGLAAEPAKVELLDGLALRHATELDSEQKQRSAELAMEPASSEPAAGMVVEPTRSNFGAVQAMGSATAEPSTGHAMARVKSCAVMEKETETSLKIAAEPWLTTEGVKGPEPSTEDEMKPEPTAVQSENSGGATALAGRKSEKEVPQEPAASAAAEPAAEDSAEWGDVSDGESLEQDAELEPARGRLGRKRLRLAPAAVRSRKAGRRAPSIRCTPDCKPGRAAKYSPCPLRNKQCPRSHVSCVELHRMLRQMGIERPERASACVKAAIQTGSIVITGDPAELEREIYAYQGGCQHRISATLGQLLRQPDYGGDDYEDGLNNATVRCQQPLVCEEEEAEPVEPEICGDVEEPDGRTYVTEICHGQPTFDCGKFHNHCTECPGFGVCIGDYREAHCRRCHGHYFCGGQGFPCPCRRRRRQAGGGGRSGEDCLLM